MPRRLGGEKRLEDTGLGLPVHSAARVAHAQHDVPPRLGGRVLPGKGFIDLNVRGLNDDSSALRHGIASIDCQVHQHLLDLTRVRVDHAQILARHALQFNVLAEQPGQHLLHVIGGLVQIHGYRLQHLPAAEGKQALRQILGRCPCILDLVDHLPVCFRQARLVFQDFAISQDHSKKIIEVMRQSPG